MTREPWDLPGLVGALRGVTSFEGQAPWERPLVVELRAVLGGLRAALFPRTFGPGHLTEESEDYFVGHTLDTTLHALLALVRQERGRGAGPGGGWGEEEALERVRQLSAQLPELRRVLLTDVQAAFDGDPAATGTEEVLLCYPGFQAILHHRIAHALHRAGVPLLARMISRIAHADTAIDIHPGAEIGESFFIDHGTGVVIGATSVLGRHVRLYQGVTLGARNFPVDERGVLKKGLPRHPVIEDHVTIYAGATVLGRVTIGAGSSIGGNVWLTQSVPPGSRITQAQARSELFDGGAGI